MDISKVLFDIFDTDIVSVYDYENRISKLQQFMDSSRQNGFQAFYRGDLFCTPTQSKLFQNNLLESEHESFENFTLINREHFQSDFEKLAYMQHYQGTTRLLDFSKDPLVALRFACGEKHNNCRKKVTFYYTNYIDEPSRSEEVEILMHLVKAPFLFSPVMIGKNLQMHGYNITLEQIIETLSQDYFVDVNFEDLRMERQKSIFLLMGNRDNRNSCRGLRNSRKNYNKLIHELSPTVGRGKMYPGYVGVFKIAAKAVPEIREELERREKYSIEWLMPKIGHE